MGSHQPHSGIKKTSLKLCKTFITKCKYCLQCSASQCSSSCSKLHPAPWKVFSQTLGWGLAGRLGPARGVSPEMDLDKFNSATCRMRFISSLRRFSGRGLSPLGERKPAVHRLGFNSSTAEMNWGQNNYCHHRLLGGHRLMDLHSARTRKTQTSASLSPAGRDAALATAP